MLHLPVNIKLVRSRLHVEQNFRRIVKQFICCSFEYMAAPQGNKFWELRLKHGRDKIFSEPKMLLNAAYEYFNWCNDNPIVANQNLGTKNVNSVSFIRPFTKDGLCVFLDIDDQTFNNYRDAEDKGFLEVCRKIERIIRSQKFDGAAIGIFNANIIARDLGLKDSTDITSGGEKIQGFNYIPPVEPKFPEDRISKGEG